jgi:hypothetical protein
MLFEIKIRLIRLGRKQKDLIPELYRRGIKASPAELSNALNGVDVGPKANRIVELSNEIIKEWEVK